MGKYVIKNFERPDQAFIEEFKKLDVATVYEAQGKEGLVNTSIKPIQQGVTICGPAVTAICYPNDNLMVHAAIETCQPGDVLVITTVGESDAGMIGELIITALMKRGVQGVIIDAGTRDVEVIRNMGFPIWTKAIHAEGTTKVRGGWVNAPTICGGANVKAGDLVLANDDGVVFIEKENLSFALEASKKRLEKEEKTKERIANNELGIDFYNLRPTLEKENVTYYESMDDLNKTTK